MNPERVEEIYDRLPQLIISLDPDPAGRGPAYLQDLISKIRGCLNEVSVYLQEVLRLKGNLESDLEAMTSAFEISSNDLMATDDRVSRLPAVQDRLAMINVILRDERRIILEKRREVNDIGYVEKAVRHRHRELEQTMSAVRLQRSLFQTEMKTGAYYGDENSNSRGDSWQGDDIESNEIEQLLSDAEVDLEAEKQLATKEDHVSVVPTAPSLTLDDSPTSGDSIDSLFDAMREGYGSDVSPEDEPFCGACGEPQIETPLGVVCENGHEGASPTRENQIDQKIEPSAKKAKDTDQKTEPAAKPKAKEPGEDPDVAAFLDEIEEFADIFKTLDESDVSG